MTSITMLGKAMLTALFVTRARGGFQMNYPESAGYNTLTEPNAPCGGAVVNIQKSNMTFWDVRGGSIYLTSEYAVTDYLFRATIDANLTAGWINLLPILQQNGIGDFCQPSVAVPDSFNGQTGILQVVASTTDGFSYQCAVLMFQSGAAPSPQGGCRNGSSVYSEYITNDSGLNMIADSSVESSGPMISSVSSMSMPMSMFSSSTSLSMSMMSTTTSSSNPAMSTTGASSTTAMLNGSDSSLKGGAIAGVVIGVVVAVSFVLLIALCLRRNFRRKDGIGQEKTYDVETTPKQFAIELSGEQAPHNRPGLDTSVSPYPRPWTPPTGFQQPQIAKPNDRISTVDSRSTTAASARISGYSDLSASAVPSTVLSPTSTSSRDQLRAEIERVRKQRQRLEEMNALSEREEQLERELEKGL